MIWIRFIILLGKMIDGHGDDLFRFDGKVKINFSTNIPQKVNHDGLLDHLRKCGAIFSNYPEPTPLSVEKHLALIHNVPDENIVVTNGATEAIYLLAHIFAGKKSAITVPTFREYQDAAKVFSHSILFINSINEIEACDADVVWLCNPNNPTGRVFVRKELLAIIDRCQDKVFIIDQAYALYSVKAVLSMDDVVSRKNVVVLHSLTKQFMIPGLRIGYAIGPVSLLQALHKLRMPWSVNSVAIEAAHYLLDNSRDYRIDSLSLHAEAERLSQALRALGVAVEPTDCNFLLAKLPYGKASQLKDWMVENHGILIRDASNFEGLTPGHFRIAAQSREENDIFIKSIKEWMSL